MSISCTTIQFRSTRPDVSFPDSTLLSRKAASVRRSEFSRISSSVGKWWEKRKRNAERLRECQIEIASAIKLDGTEGIRFVRLALDGPEMSIGWGVYELWLKAAKLNV